MDLLYASSVHLDALRDWCEDFLPAGAVVHARVLPPGVTAPFWLLEAAVPGDGAGPAGPMMAGDQWSALVVIARSVGRVASESAAMADALRWRIAGRSPDGSYRWAMATLAGSPVLERASGNDVVPDVVAGIPQYSETFTVRLGRGANDTLV